MKLFKLSFIFLLFLLIFSRSVLAIYDPTIFPNNKFGIHIADINDLAAAAKLVNSSKNQSADWGYVTFVIQANDRNQEKWTKFFRELRQHHLIPIVRLATWVEGANWVKPKKEDISSWVEFLNKLPWPIENRYVVLFNEPNHAKEWGGDIDPDQYANIASQMLAKLKDKSDNFFVLPAGFDLYATNQATTMEASYFWQQMERASLGILSRFDGWISHSYPSSNYSGPPDESGRKSIVGYKWEVSYLAANFAVREKIPVFITETGWRQSNGLSEQTIAKYYQVAFGEIWEGNTQVIAVTPFLLNYQDSLFADFSWRKLGQEEYRPQYYLVQQMNKILGQPLVTPVTRFGQLILKDRLHRLLKYQEANIDRNSSDFRHTSLKKLMSSRSGSA